MQIQRFLKGVCGIDRDDVERILSGAGILSNWWHDQDEITPPEIVERLTETNLLAHLNDYDQPNPATGRTYGETTPFISTTAGAAVRDAAGQRNVVLTAEYVATSFATDGFRRAGWVFSGYVFTLGREAVAQQGFAEEVRELHIYTGFLPFQREGEIVAKVYIPAIQLEEAWELRPVFDPLDPGATGWPREVDRIFNRGVYVPPEELVNLRGLLA